jgi:hypothetical protein
MRAPNLCVASCTLGFVLLSSFPSWAYRGARKEILDRKEATILAKEVVKKLGDTQHRLSDDTYARVFTMKNASPSSHYIVVGRMSSGANAVGLAVYEWTMERKLRFIGKANVAGTDIAKSIHLKDAADLLYIPGWRMQTKPYKTAKTAREAEKLRAEYGKYGWDGKHLSQIFKNGYGSGIPDHLIDWLVRYNMKEPGTLLGGFEGIAHSIVYKSLNPARDKEDKTDLHKRDITYDPKTIW